MAASNFPGGFPNGVTIRNIPLQQTNPGRVFWVDNGTTGLLPGQVGGADGGAGVNYGTFNRPFASVAYAVSRCFANDGDIILVKPLHAETITENTLFALNVAGVSIIGLGVGAQRPTFTFTTAATATIPVTANNMSFQNCIFVANFLSVAACFTIASATNFTVQNCTFSDTSGVLNFLNIFQTTGAANTANSLYISGCTWNGLGTTSVNSFLLSANAIDSLSLISNNVCLARTATAAILVTMTAGVLTNLDCGSNKVYSLQTASTGGSLISVTGTTSSGWVYDNKIQIGAAGGDLICTTTVGLSFFNNLNTDAVGASGFLIPTADS